MKRRRVWVTLLVVMAVAVLLVHLETRSGPEQERVLSRTSSGWPLPEVTGDARWA